MPLLFYNLLTPRSPAPEQIGKPDSFNIKICVTTVRIDLSSSNRANLKVQIVAGAVR
jgi:hypothetical protein